MFLKIANCFNIFEVFNLQIDESQWIEEDNVRIMHCTAPLAELVGFAKTIRTLSSGTADFHMQLAGYETMSADNVEKLKLKLSSSNF